MDRGADKRPNILLLLADQFRWDCLGFLKERGVKTPHLDRLASRSAVFTRAYTPMPVCAPARQALITGRHPDHIGAFWNYDFFHTPTAQPRDAWTTRLPALGYRTGYIGKWHCSPVHGPEDFGYQDVIRSADYKAQLKQKYPDAAPGGWFGGDSTVPLEETVTHYMAREAANRLTGYAAEGRPWHIWADFDVPHLPCQPSAPFSAMYDAGAIPPWPGFGDQFDNKPYIHAQQSVNWRLEDLSWDDFAPMVSRYYAMISQLDDALGIILTALEESGQYDNTLIFFTADHGDMCGSHQMLDKHYVLYDDVVRVPLMAHMPGSAPFVSDALVSAELDIAATVGAALGLDPGDTPHGSPLPISPEDHQNPRAYITSSCNGQQFGLYCARMITDGVYKYVWNMTDTDELYCLADDPGEHNSLIHAPEQADTLQRLRCHLHEALKAHGDPFILKGWLDAQLLEGRKL